MYAENVYKILCLHVNQHFYARYCTVIRACTWPVVVQYFSYAMCVLNRYITYLSMVMYLSSEGYEVSVRPFLSGTSMVVRCLMMGAQTNYEIIYLYNE